VAAKPVNHGPVWAGGPRRCPRPPAQHECRRGRRRTLCLPGWRNFRAPTSSRASLSHAAGFSPARSRRAPSATSFRSAYACPFFWARIFCAVRRKHGAVEQQRQRPAGRPAGVHGVDRLVDDADGPGMTTTPSVRVRRTGSENMTGPRSPASAARREHRARNHDSWQSAEFVSTEWVPVDLTAVG
jgi:hypothetical protein